jgi:hypothetical protein
MPADWSQEEVAATVADYFDMLAAELRGERINKNEHIRQLYKILRNRSVGAIGFKYSNISAVLVELGFPYIDGYKPRGNYQILLRDEIVSRLDDSAELRLLTSAIVEASASKSPIARSLSDILVPPPIRYRHSKHVYDDRKPTQSPRRNVNYLEIEARNASLGLSGELFALEFEHRRLWETNHRALANRIEHVSQTQGDGLGYDILSFDLDGRERLIEVKTTNFGPMTPFFVARREVTKSSEEPSKFNLYRVFGYRKAPQLFMVPGSLKETFVLDPTEYRASVSSLAANE